MIGAYILIVNATGASWFAQTTYEIAKMAGLIFSWLPLANYLSSINSVLVYKQVSVYKNVPPLEQTPLGPYGAQTFVRA